MQQSDVMIETAKSRVEKFHGDIAWEFDGDLLVPVQAGEIVSPFDIVEKDHNALFYGGSSNFWQCLLGNGTGTAGQTLTFFNNANAAIGVGDSTTANALGNNDLTAATNKLRRAMDATYPLHSAGVVVGARDCVFRSTFATGDANWAWEEWGVFNSPTAATGRMLNRVTGAALGTKTSAATWVLTVTLTLA
jgi:hypothetical protein